MVDTEKKNHESSTPISPELSLGKLPDVAREKSLAKQFLALDLVGMSGVEIPILISKSSPSLMAGSSTQQLISVPAFADLYVNLINSKERGIHMSRLHKIAGETLSKTELSFSLLGGMLLQFLDSHLEQSDFAKVEISFSAPVLRPALTSPNFGWRSYPVRISAEQKRGQAPQFFIEVRVLYSSTCPASAALARQVAQQSFAKAFSQELIEKSQVEAWLLQSEPGKATAHAQRSLADIKIELSPSAALSESFDWLDLIDIIEHALGTPVQSFVNREDEREFAIRNGENLMFCEDAARVIQGILNATPVISDYVGEIRHRESLHPHDAVAKISRTGKLSMGKSFPEVGI